MALTEPAQRRDRRCVQDGKLLTPLAVVHGDPFCSAGCCRAYHGIVFVSDEDNRGRKPKYA